MFWYTLIKEDEYINTVKIARRNIQEFRSDKDKIVELQSDKIKYLEKCIEDLTKDIPHYWWIIWDINNKRATDKQLKYPKNNSLPEWVTYDMINYWVIDRKQGKIAILLK